MHKLTDEETEYLAHLLTTMMRAANKGDTECQAFINSVYDHFPKEVADNMLALARAAAGEELAETIQAFVKVPKDAKFGGQA